MAFPTLPTFELVQGQVAVLKKTSTAGDILGQVLRVTPQQQINTTKHPRLGDTTQKTSYAPVTHSVAIEFYTEHDPDQLALLLGDSDMYKPASGGWVGDEEIRLNPTVSPFLLLVEVYDENSLSGALEWTYVLTDFLPSSLNVQFQGDSILLTTINGECDNSHILPTATLGA